MSQHAHPTPDGWIIVDYQRTPRDTFVVEFSGELLRQSTFKWDLLVDALRGMAKNDDDVPRLSSPESTEPGGDE